MQKFAPPINCNKNSGFTLIELSIVLVIIGLIIGGILVGRDLIKAAEIRAQISQIEKYNSAVNTFYGKYGGIPGDFALTLANQFGFTTPASCTGIRGERDGNGLIESSYAQFFPDLQHGETVIFWQDLTTAGYIDGNFPRAGATALGCANTSAISQTGVSNYLPAGKLFNSSVYIYPLNGFNWFGLSAVNGIDGGGTINNGTTGAPTSVSVIQAYNIDKKIDDAIATTGTVVAQYVDYPSNNYTQTLAPSANPDTASTCYNSSTNAYSTSINSGTGINCGLSFRMISPGR